MIIGWSAYDQWAIIAGADCSLGGAFNQSIRQHWPLLVVETKERLIWSAAQWQWLLLGISRLNCCWICQELYLRQTPLVEAVFCFGNGSWHRDGNAFNILFPWWRWWWWWFDTCAAIFGWGHVMVMLGHWAALRGQTPLHCKWSVDYQNMICWTVKIIMTVIRGCSYVT